MEAKIFGFAMWPISHMLGILTLGKPTSESIKQTKPKYFMKAYPDSPREFIGKTMRVWPILAVTFLANYFYPIQQQMAESKAGVDRYFAGDSDLTNQTWIFKIALRDLIFSLTACLGWQWFIVYSPWSQNLRPLKYNKDYQPSKHVPREILFSISTILCGTFLEVAIMILYATGYINTWYLDWSQHVFSRWIWIITLPFWRGGHFWFSHRVMHDWDTKYIPDVGKWLYKNVHYLHHQSRNIQPLSGISMHPIEGLIYESAVFVPLLFIHHPMLINLIKIDLTYAAVIDHDGHDYPGHGGWFHTVHHLKIKANYGSPSLPFDWLFGTHDPGDSKDLVDSYNRYLKELNEEEQPKKK